MKKILSLLLLIAVVLSMAFAYWYSKKTRGQAPVVSPSIVVDNAVEVQKQRDEAKAIDDAMKATSKVDKDFDGLTDVEEKKYGTDPLVADTDGDGLTDFYEINTYHTNPLKRDTDGDGYPDGIEVRRGFNPLDPGVRK